MGEHISLTENGVVKKLKTQAIRVRIKVKYPQLDAVLDKAIGGEDLMEMMNALVEEVN